MSLVAVYDALKAANVDDAKATAAVEAIETVREEARLRRIEESIVELRADMNAQVGELRADMNAQITELRADMNTQNAKLRADMEKGFGEVRAEIGELRADMRSEIRLLKWMIGFTITFMLANFALTGAILLRLAS